MKRNDFLTLKLGTNENLTFNAPSAYAWRPPEFTSLSFMAEKKLLFEVGGKTVAWAGTDGVLHVDRLEFTRSALQHQPPPRSDWPEFLTTSVLLAVVVVAVLWFDTELKRRPL